MFGVLRGRSAPYPAAAASFSGVGRPRGMRSGRNSGVLGRSARAMRATASHVFTAAATCAVCVAAASGSAPAMKLPVWSDAVGVERVDGVVEAFASAGLNDATELVGVFVQKTLGRRAMIGALRPACFSFVLLCTAWCNVGPTRSRDHADRGLIRRCRRCDTGARRPARVVR